MTTFDRRKEGFEAKFAQDEEMRFRLMARRNRLFALWAAEKLGRTGDEATGYIKEIARADLEAPGHADVIAKAMGDFRAAGVSIGEAEVEQRLERAHADAMRELESEARPR